ncbi:MAG: Arm DNA-binding domain-containing protein [Rhodospirillales bacterium]|nr:Arm DNA-binding domain-containing protein [Rhodospirillales bacterium]
MTLTAQTVDTLQPRDSRYIAWDDRLTGFGVRVHPTGLRSYLVNYRVGNRGRKAPKRRIFIGRHGLVTADQARR